MKNIEIHIDFACPFSYMGGERMLQFLEKNEADFSHVRFRSFQLQPDDNNQSPNYLMNRFKASGMGSVQEYQEFFNNGVGKAAAAIGLQYNVDTIVSVNSIHAHMGLQYATLYGKQGEYFREVMSAHFEQGKDYYDFAVLDDILMRLRLDVEDFHSRQSEMKQLVAKDIALADERGIHSVPVFYQDGIVLRGTGSMEEFEKMMF